ncbi:hypothetical protein BG004_000485 [Podila humilis]|nr:hypothetical protein BG004_000485 [Podila humilis]
MHSRMYSNDITETNHFVLPRTRYGRKSGWTPELDQEILKLRAAKKTWEFIGLAIGRSSTNCADRFNTVLDPSLKDWTPKMIAKLDQMVEEGASWRTIAATFNAKIMTCQHQWKTLGNGANNVKGMAALPHTPAWSDFEMESFWDSWIKSQGANGWDRIQADVGGRSIKEYRAGLRQLVMSSVIHAPGWAKLEIYNYVTDVTKSARARARKQESHSLNAAAIDKRWTPSEHAKLLKEVEQHGLFYGWAKIRKLVKPRSTDELVEAEYYRLSGIDNSSSEAPSEAEADAVSHDEESNWTEEEVDKLNMMLMKYSTLPVWEREAEKHGVVGSDDDLETLFESTTSLQKQNSYTRKKTRQLKNWLESQPAPHNWNAARVQRLKRLVSQQQTQCAVTQQPMDWNWVAEHIGPDVDAKMCIAAFQSLPEEEDKSAPQPWGAKDVALLVEGIKTHGRKWREIQKQFLPGRTTDSLRRKVSNIYDRRENLIAAQRKVALKIKRSSDPELDVNAFVEEALKKKPAYVLGGSLDVLFREFGESEKSEQGEHGDHGEQSEQGEHKQKRGRPPVYKS